MGYTTQHKRVSLSTTCQEHFNSKRRKTWDTPAQMVSNAIGTLTDISDPQSFCKAKEVLLSQLLNAKQTSSPLLGVICAFLSEIQNRLIINPSPSDFEQNRFGYELLKFVSLVIETYKETSQHEFVSLHSESASTLCQNIIGVMNVFSSLGQPFAYCPNIHNILQDIAYFFKIEDLLLDDLSKNCEGWLTYDLLFSEFRSKNNDGYLLNTSSTPPIPFKNQALDFLIQRWKLLNDSDRIGLDEAFKSVCTTIQSHPNPSTDTSFITNLSELLQSLKIDPQQVERMAIIIALTYWTLIDLHPIQQNWISAQISSISLPDCTIHSCDELEASHELTNTLIRELQVVIIDDIRPVSALYEHQQLLTFLTPTTFNQFLEIDSVKLEDTRRQAIPGQPIGEWLKEITPIPSVSCRHRLNVLNFDPSSPANAVFQILAHPQILTSLLAIPIHSSLNLDAIQLLIRMLLCLIRSEYSFVLDIIRIKDFHPQPSPDMIGFSAIEITKQHLLGLLGDIPSQPNLFLTTLLRVIGLSADSKSLFFSVLTLSESAQSVQHGIRLLANTSIEPSPMCKIPSSVLFVTFDSTPSPTQPHRFFEPTITLEGVTYQLLGRLDQKHPTTPSNYVATIAITPTYWAYIDDQAPLLPLPRFSQSVEGPVLLPTHSAYLGVYQAVIPHTKVSSHKLLLFDIDDTLIRTFEDESDIPTDFKDKVTPIVVPHPTPSEMHVFVRHGAEPFLNAITELATTHSVELGIYSAASECYASFILNLPPLRSLAKTAAYQHFRSDTLTLFWSDEHIHNHKSIRWLLSTTQNSNRACWIIDDSEFVRAANPNHILPITPIIRGKLHANHPVPPCSDDGQMDVELSKILQICQSLLTQESQSADIQKAWISPQHSELIHAEMFLALFSNSKPSPLSIARIDYIQSCIHFFTQSIDTISKNQSQSLNEFQSDLGHRLLTGAIDLINTLIDLELSHNPTVPFISNINISIPSSILVRVFQKAITICYAHHQSSQISELVKWLLDVGSRLLKNNSPMHKLEIWPAIVVSILNHLESESAHHGIWFVQTFPVEFNQLIASVFSTAGSSQLTGQYGWNLSLFHATILITRMMQHAIDVAPHSISERHLPLYHQLHTLLFESFYLIPETRLQYIQSAWEMITLQG